MIAIWQIVEESSESVAVDTETIVEIAQQKLLSLTS